MKLIFMGTPDFASEVLKALYKADFEILAAVSQPDKPAGRHAGLRPTAVRKTAEELGIPVLQPEKASDPGFIEKVRELVPDVIVVAAYGRILKKELLSIPRYGCINVHASLLPRWRGAAPIQWSIIAGDSETGVTTMLMNEGLDTGDMLLRARVPVMPDETGGSLFDKLAVIGGYLIVDTLNAMYNGELLPVPQDEREATYASMLKKEDGNIDWSLSAEEIERKVRGLYPWPGTYSYSGGKLIKILSARVFEPSETTDVLDESGCGKADVSDGKHIVIACGTGKLEILRLQPEGKKPMAAEDYLRGNSIIRLASKKE